MSAATTVKPRKRWLSTHSALSIILVSGLGYVALYRLQTDNTPTTFLQFLPGVLAVLTLLAAGFSFEDCFLRPAPLSRLGLMYLGASLLLMPVLWITSRWVGWSWTAALIYAPASGFSQELYFRAALLPALFAVLPSKPNLAVALHALLFSAWHVPKAAMAAPIGAIIAVVLVTFLAGFFWAKEVQRDRSVFWLMGFHSIILFINSFFTWG